MPEEKDRPKIRHIVISGGGGIGIAYYGALRESNKDGFWNIDDIQTIHGISCGAIFAVVVTCLKQIGWDDYDDFFIKRPWEQVFKISPEKLVNAFTNSGICGQEDITNAILPLLKAADLTVDSNFQQLYDLTGIEMHFYATNFNTYELVDISHKTHPDWKIVEALYSSAALPILFRPNVVDGVCYVDGGFLCNYPINQCLEMAADPDEIFGLNKIDPPVNEDDPPLPVANYANILEYVSDIVSKTMCKLSVPPKKTRYTMEFMDENDPMFGLYSAIKTRESRYAKIQEGVNAWTKFKTQIGFCGNAGEES